MTGTIQGEASRRSPAPDTAAASRVRRTGMALAAVTAVVSGVSVFVNGYGVRHFDDPTTYTTAKNLIAALAIGAALLARRAHARREPSAPVSTPLSSTGPRRRWVMLGTVALIGGCVPFVLFFEGLARVSSSDAAFIHKSLIIWVALLGTLVLHERLSAPHVAAIVAILAGYARLSGGVGLPELGDGELLLLAATLCWSVEVIVARSLLRRGVSPLTVGTWRMAGGVVLLLAWASARGAIGELVGLSSTQWGWVLLTGAFLTVYVVTWHHALARAQAVDVTAVLASGAVLTAALESGFRGIPIEPVGSLLLLTGGLLVVAAGRAPRWTGAT